MNTHEKTSEQLTSLVEERLKGGGVDLFAVLPIEFTMSAEPGYRPIDIMPEAKSVIVYAIRMFNFPRQEKMTDNGMPLGRIEYTSNFFIAANLLDQLGYRVACMLDDLGFETIPISAGPPYDGRILHGLISHKYMAELAGLTQRAIADFTVSPQFGPRIRLMSLITTAPLTTKVYDKPILCDKEKCNFACAQACPAGALNDGKLDKNACDRYNEIIIASGPSKIRCGRCIQACPVGR